MKGLRLNHNGETRIFRPNGEVAVVIDGEPVVKGRWQSQSIAGEAKDNKIRYNLNGTDQDPISVHYSFNQFNQLEATIPAEANGGQDSQPFAFIGQIVIDDNHDLTYALITSEGQGTGRNVIVYGDLRFSDDSKKLVIDLEGGGTAEIKGATGIESIEARRNNVSEFRGDDLLKFAVFTRNKLETFPFRVPLEAKIEFVGNWDLLESGQLAFVSKVKGDLSKPDVTLGLSGKVKGVSGGFVYFADEEGTQFAFNVAGKHTWNSGAAKWELSLGFSEEKFEADFEGEIRQQFGEGRQLTIAGKASFNRETDAGVTTTEVDLELNATYEWDDENKLVFKAQVSGDNTDLNYDLQLEGQFVFKSGTLSFQVKFSEQDADQSFELKLGFEGNQDSLVKALSLVLDVNPDQVSLSFEFELRMSWEDGVRVKSEPTALAA